MNQAQTPRACASIGCNHNVPEGEDFCAECQDLLKSAADTLIPRPLSDEEKLMDQYLASTTGEITDPVVEANRQLLLQRSRVGIKKYGVTLENAALSRREHLQHALEEALDLANYLQAEIMRIDRQAA